MDEVICKLPLQGGNAFCVLKTKLICYGFDLKMYYNGKALTGQLNEKSIEEFSGLLSMTVKDYMDNSISALTCYGGAKDFTYAIDNATFSWTKCVGPEIGIKFGYVELKTAPVLEILENIMDDSVDLNAKFAKDKEKLQKENEKLLLNYQEMSELLEKERCYKQEMECELYSRFLIILNSKKKKIIELKEKLHLKDTDSLNSSDKTQPNNSINHYDSDTDSDIDQLPECSFPKTKLFDFKTSGTFNLPRRQKGNEATSCSADKL